MNFNGAESERGICIWKYGLYIKRRGLFSGRFPFKKYNAYRTARGELIFLKKKKRKKKKKEREKEKKKKKEGRGNSAVEATSLVRRVLSARILSPAAFFLTDLSAENYRREETWIRLRRFRLLDRVYAKDSIFARHASVRLATVKYQVDYYSRRDLQAIARVNLGDDECKSRIRCVIIPCNNPRGSSLAFVR